MSFNNFHYDIIKYFSGSQDIGTKILFCEDTKSMNILIFKKIIYLFLDCYLGGTHIGYGLKKFIGRMFQNTTFNSATKKHLEFLDREGNIIIKSNHSPLEVAKMLKNDLKSYCEEENFSYSQEALSEIKKTDKEDW